MNTVFEKLNIILKKVLTKEIIFYAIFGVLTTLVNIGSFYIFTIFLNLEKNTANFISILLAVIFAYFTNRKLVFNSQATNFKENLNEFIKFFLGRAFTMVVEFVGFFVLFNLLHIHELISKTTITVIVIILNFFISKFFAFKKK